MYGLVQSNITHKALLVLRDRAPCSKSWKEQLWELGVNVTINNIIESIKDALDYE